MVLRNECLRRPSVPEDLTRASLSPAGVEAESRCGAERSTCCARREAGLWCFAPLMKSSRKAGIAIVAGGLLIALVLALLDIRITAHGDPEDCAASFLVHWWARSRRSKLARRIRRCRISGDVPGHCGTLPRAICAVRHGSETHVQI